MKRKLLARSIGVPVACLVGATALNCSSGAIVLPGVADSGNGGNGGSSSSSSGGGSSSGSGSSGSSSSGAGSSSSGSGSSSSSGGAAGSSSSGSSSGGGSSSGSSSSSGGGVDGGVSGAGPLTALDNQEWVLPCGPNQGYSDLVCVNQGINSAMFGGHPGNNNCPGNNPPAYIVQGTVNRDQTITVGGNPATTYTVKARFVGVVEPKQYQGGTKQTPAVATDGWYTGGTPTTNDNYNVYMLQITAPAQVYYLNALGNQTPQVARAHFSYPIDYMATFQVQGGTMVRFLADDSNCSAIKNCSTASVDGSGGNGRCVAITIPNLVTTPPAGQPVITQPYNGQFVIMQIQSVTPPQ